LQSTSSSPRKLLTILRSAIRLRGTLHWVAAATGNPAAQCSGCGRGFLK
jgi:hypothetical protein